MSAPCPQSEVDSSAPGTRKVAAPLSAACRKIGPHSRVLDRAARFLRAYEKMLADHLGGQPSRVQKELIRLAARLALRIELMDERALGANAAPTYGDKTYLAWHARLVRTLAQIGLHDAAERPMTRDEVLAALYGAGTL